MTWAAIAKALINREIATGTRPADCWNTLDPAQLSLNYSRAAHKLFDQACLMGFATPPDDTVSFGNGTGSKVTLHPDAEEKLRELTHLIQKEEAAVGALDATYIATLKKATRSERERLRQLVSSTEKRVRYGRPYMTRKEAEQSRPSRDVWSWSKQRNEKRAHPAITDRELLGSERYEELIAERVAEVKSRKHTELELFHAENPGKLPQYGGYHSDRKNGTYTLWPDDPAAEIERKAVILVSLVGTFLYPSTRGRTPKSGKRSGITVGALCTLVMKQTEVFGHFVIQPQSRYLDSLHQSSVPSLPPLATDYVYNDRDSNSQDCAVFQVLKVVQHRRRKYNAPESPKLWQELQDYKELFPAPCSDPWEWICDAYPKAVEFYATNTGLNI